MGKRKKRILIVLSVLIVLLLASAAAFFVVFDVANWQRLDPARLHGLAQTSSLYDADGELMSFYHAGFWQCMDTQREKKLLEDLWASGKAPWKRWE